MKEKEHYQLAEIWVHAIENVVDPEQDADDVQRQTEIAIVTAAHATNVQWLIYDLQAMPSK
jgi:hypothetical protein